MLFQLLILLLIVGLVFFQSIQGLYSALVMAICSVLAAALAINYYEPLAGWLAGFMPKFADAVALAGLFAVALAALRIAADRLLGGMVHFPFIVDRAVAAVVGVVPALLICGVLVLSWRMLPFGQSILGFRDFDAAPAASSSADLPAPHGLWLGPDRFAVWTIETLSRGSLSGSQDFAEAHPDFRLELAGFSHTPLSTSRQAAGDAIVPTAVIDAKGQSRSLAAPAWWVRDTSEAPRMLLDMLDSSAAAPADQKRPPLAFRDRGQAFSLLRVHLEFKMDGGADPDHVLRLSGGQVQLHCRQTDSAGRVRPDARTELAIAGWIVEDPNDLTGAEPLGLSNFWLARPTSGGRLPPAALLFAVPTGFAPWFITVQRDTRAEVTVMGEGDRAAPVVLAGQSAVVSVPPNFPLTDLHANTTTDLPVRLMVKGPQTGNVQCNAGSAELHGGMLAVGKLQGRQAAFATMLGGELVAKFAPDPNADRMVMLEGVPRSNEAVLAAWSDLLAASAKFSGRERAASGVYVKGENYWVVFYDRPAGPDRFNGIDLDRLATEAGRIERVGLILAIPRHIEQFIVSFGGAGAVSLDVRKQ